MFQGMGKDTDVMNRDFGFEPTEINYLILSHAHIDHCGLIPKLVKDGYNGKIFSTPATKDLAALLMEDSAGIQEHELKYINKSRAAEGLPYFEPLYSTEDAQRAVELFEVVEYNQWHTIDESVSFIYKDAGHIIGSATVHLKINENGKETHLSFSGDVGRYRDEILRSPDVFPQADYILLESTYGNSLHEEITGTGDLLLQWITKTCIEKKGKLILPAFSVGRTQEILFDLNQLQFENRLPQVPYYVDSPLSMEATQVIKSYPQYFNSRIQEILKSDQDPFDFPGLKFIRSVEESKSLNEVVITSEREDQNIKSMEMSSVKMDIKQISKIPALLGEVDIIRAIQLLPGVTTMGEGATGFNVRGGNIDQNLILLDVILTFLQENGVRSTRLRQCYFGCSQYYC